MSDISALQQIDSIEASIDDEAKILSDELYRYPMIKSHIRNRGKWLSIRGWRLVNLSKKAAKTEKIQSSMKLDEAEVALADNDPKTARTLVIEASQLGFNRRRSATLLKRIEELLELQLSIPYWENLLQQKWDAGDTNGAKYIINILRKRDKHNTKARHYAAILIDIENFMSVANRSVQTNQPATRVALKTVLELMPNHAEATVLQQQLTDES